MANPDQFGRYNRKRYIMLFVIVFVVVISFFAGKWYGHKTNLSPDNSGAAMQPGSDRVGIPPDSLPH
jgi:hypothetical protein